jgi:flagellar assembly protein FliH
MKAAPSKYLFDLDFARGADAKAAERTISDAEHAAALLEAEAAGYRKGFGAAEAQAKAEVERRTAGALESIGQSLALLVGGLQGVEARLEADAIGVAVEVARKLAPELIAREPMAEIEAIATECFRQLVRAPHVAVRVNDGLYDVAREKLDALARARGYEGRLVVLGEPDIAMGDCRVEWADGGITRDRPAAEAAIGDAVKRYLSARLPAGADPIGRHDA